MSVKGGSTVYIYMYGWVLCCMIQALNWIFTRNVFHIYVQCVKLTLARSPMAILYRHLATYFLFPSTIFGNCVRLAQTCGARHVRHKTWAYAATWRAREQVGDDFGAVRVCEAVGCDISLSHHSIRQWYHTGRCLKQQKSCRTIVKREVLQQWVGGGMRMAERK